MGSSRSVRPMTEPLPVALPFAEQRHGRIDRGRAGRTERGGEGIEDGAQARAAQLIRHAPCRGAAMNCASSFASTGCRSGVVIWRYSSSASNLYTKSATCSCSLQSQASCRPNVSTLPSTLSVWPVMCDPADDTRKGRGIGDVLKLGQLPHDMRLRIFCFCSSLVMPKQCRAGLRVSLMGADQPRKPGSSGIHADAVGDPVPWQGSA